MLVYYPIKFDICLPGGAPPHLTLSPSPNVLSQILPNIHCAATGIIISLFKCKPLWNDTLPSAVLQRNLMRKCNPREFHLKRLQKCPISSTEVFLISVFLEQLPFVIVGLVGIRDQIRASISFVMANSCQLSTKPTNLLIFHLDMTKYLGNPNC